jgi:DNA-binding response OmpR family regulator
MPDPESQIQPDRRPLRESVPVAAGSAFDHDVNVDLRYCEIRIRAKRLRLRRCTYGLEVLEWLARRPGYRWTVQEVLDGIWGRGEGTPETLRTHVSRLRRLLRQSPDAEFHDLARRIRCADGAWYLDQGAEL